MEYLDFVGFIVSGKKLSSAKEKDWIEKLAQAFQYRAKVESKPQFPGDDVVMIDNPESARTCINRRLTEWLLAKYNNADLEIGIEDLKKNRKEKKDIG